MNNELQPFFSKWRRYLPVGFFIMAFISIIQRYTIAFLGSTGNAAATFPHLHYEIMEIAWLAPVIIRNVNPYPELIAVGK